MDVWSCVHCCCYVTAMHCFCIILCCYEWSFDGACGVWPIPGWVCGQCMLGYSQLPLFGVPTCSLSKAKASTRTLSSSFQKGDHVSIFTFSGMVDRWMDWLGEREDLGAQWMSEAGSKLDELLTGNFKTATTFGQNTFFKKSKYGARNKNVDKSRWNPSKNIILNG